MSIKEKLDISFPAVIRWKSNTNIRKNFPFFLEFENDTEKKGYPSLNVYQHIYRLTKLCNYILAVEVNGIVIWIQREGFKYTLDEVEDVLYNRSNGKFSSRREEFMNYFEN